MAIPWGFPLPCTPVLREYKKKLSRHDCTVTGMDDAAVVRIRCLRLCRTPLLRLVVDLLYNMLLQQAVRQVHNKSKADSKSTTSCRTNSKSYNKLDNLSHSKSTASCMQQSYNLLYDKSQLIQLMESDTMRIRRQRCTVYLIPSLSVLVLVTLQPPTSRFFLRFCSVCPFARCFFSVF